MAGWPPLRRPDRAPEGAITLNPVKHFDPAGMLCLVFFAVGWAKPCPSTRCISAITARTI